MLRVLYSFRHEREKFLVFIVIKKNYSLQLFYFPVSISNILLFF